MTCPHLSNGDCAKGYHGGRPSLGVCVSACPDKMMGLRGLGDLVASVATPIAAALGLLCVDPATKALKPDSNCAKRQEAMNQAVPFNPTTGVK